MKEIPILFSSPMVQAILEGRKSQTRRLVKWPNVPEWHDWDYEASFVVKPKDGTWWPHSHHIGLHGSEYKDIEWALVCPYGQPGDVFYVREEHYRYGAWVEKEGEFTEGGRQKWMFVAHSDELLYEAPAVFRKGRHHKDPYTPAWHKRLARFMPKSAARIWLQKESTKVERACEISFADAVAEGLACISKDGGITWKYGIPDLDGYPGIDNIGWPWQEWNVNPVEAFKTLWAKVNSLDTWSDWVWVISFKVLSTTGKPDLNNLQKQNNEPKA